MFVFIDESGNLIGDKNEVFIVGGFITSDPKRTARVFRKWQHCHFPKKIRRKSEVKFTDTGLNEELRFKTFTFFVGQDIRVFYVFFKISNIPAEYRRKKGLESGLLYTAIVEQALRLLLRIVGVKNNAHVNLKIEEPEGSTRMPRENQPESSVQKSEEY